MCVLAPADEVCQLQTTAILQSRSAQNRSDSLRVVVAKHAELGADIEACAADIRSWLSYADALYGPWTHGEQFIAFIWGPGRGMEYDGATTAAVEALEHEVFHSWFGRGVKPESSRDGWIDEAWTCWATSTQRQQESRFAQVELGLDEDPVELCPPHPWSRHTPIEAYTQGARLMSGVANLIGGPHRLRSAMASVYRSHAGGFLATDQLCEELSRFGEVDLTPWWNRYVHGLG
jgi:hypothetical protein